MNTKAVRRRMAEGFLHDSELETSSIDLRATATFDAGYFFLLVALEAPTGGVDGMHPGLELLNQAVAKFGLDPSVMEPAWAFIAQQYSPGGGGRLIQNLLTWARQMKQLADTDGA